ncbi:MAG: DUF2807 domain-containing protein [Lentimicrobiaceae bacterium]|nr:DUF2807 domain-containing protein [Lentimicrobiaceae bacterium]
MKKIITLISIMAICLSLLFNSCVAFAKEVNGNGKLVTQSVSVSNFSKIEIETYVEIDYSQGKSKGSLEFTVDENLLDYYNIYTKSGVLYIELKKEHKNKVYLKPTKTLITISSEQLEKIDIAGSSKINFCTPYTSKALEIDLAGSGSIFADRFPVKIEELEIDIAGSGNVHLMGAVREAKIDMAGSGNVYALECKIANLLVDIAGSGNVEAHVTDKLNADIAGSGDVKFKGEPVVTTDIAGSGKVKKL